MEHELSIDPREPIASPPGFRRAGGPIASPPGFRRAEPPVDNGDPPTPAGGYNELMEMLWHKQTGKRKEAEAARAARIQEQLPDAQFDAEKKFTGGAWGLIRQIDISRSGALEDKQRKFYQSFPEGDFISVPLEGESVLLARSDKSEPYRELRFGAQVTGALVSEPTIGGVAGSLTPLGPIGTAIGTGLGALAQSGIERAREFGKGEAGIAEATKEGAFAGAMDIAMRGAGRLVLGPKRTPLKVQAINDAIKAAEELGLEPLAVGQVGGPLMRGTFTQVSATSPKVENLVIKQERSLLEAFRRLGNDVPASASDDTLLAVVRAQQRELESLISPLALGRTDAGTVLQQGLETYVKASARLRDILYNRAHALADDVAYSLKPAQTLAQEIKVGVLGRGKEVTRTEISPIVDEFGQPFTKEVIEQKLVALAETPAGKLATAVDDVLALATTVTKLSAKGGEWTAFEQIKTLRTRLFDLKHSDDGAVRREASRLWSALTEVMDNPISGNPAFTAAHKRARYFNRLREDTLEKTFVARGLATDTPETLAKTYMAPGHATALATIRDIVPRPKFEEFRSAFMVDVISSPTANQGLARLRAFRAYDEDGLRILVSKDEERMLEQYLMRKSRFEASPVRDMLSKQLTEAEKFMAMARQGTAGNVADAVRLAGGKGSDYAKFAKAGVYKNILDESSLITKHGVEIIDPRKLVSSIEGWKKSGKLDALMDPDDWARLANVQKYASPIAETSDVGGSMMAGGARQQAIELPAKALRAEPTAVGAAVKLWHKLLSNDITAWILSRPAPHARVGMGGTASTAAHRLGLALIVTQYELEHKNPQPERTQ